ncbi:MAG TPA: flagellar protein FlaG [Steroidobacteraceae bacterium]|nr:flagellar protein FlaG [Steroidobacteraceae bacterium]
MATPTAGPSPSDGVPGLPVHAVDPVPPVPAVGQGGNPSPPAGEILPAHAAAAQGGIIALQAAVDGVNRFLRDSQRQIVFQVDLKSGQEVVTIVNPATGEVIRQIPSAQVLAAASNLQQAGMPMAGLFVDERA